MDDFQGQLLGQSRHPWGYVPWASGILSLGEDGGTEKVGVWVGEEMQLENCRHVIEFWNLISSFI